MIMNKLIIISGCSGGGKSTLLAELSNQGYTVIPEVGREIVKEQLSAKGNSTPWQNPKSFCELVIERSKTRYYCGKTLQGAKDRLIFFDRSILDGISFYQTLNIKNNDQYDSLISQLRYYQDVFFAPPWEEIFLADDERKHSFEDAVSEYHRLLKFYAQSGYQIINLPKITIKDRVQFILSKIKNDKESSFEI